MTAFDQTHDPKRRSWVASANRDGADFPIQNLPFGVFSPAGGVPRFGIAIGDGILDVGAARDAGLLSGAAADAADAAQGGGQGGALNPLFALPASVRTELRRQVSALLDAGGPARPELLHDAAACRLLLPTEVRNYTDFYAGIYHARAAGALMAPDNPLPPNYKWVPIAYHGRASSVRASGGDVRRPQGQRPPSSGGDGRPGFGPSQRLDIELEMGFYIGPGNALGEPIPIAEAGERIVGFCLLNDWSARDIQRWEMFPLGPFLGKSFSTTVSPWVITADALLPFRASAMVRPEGDPAPLDHLLDGADQESGGLDVELTVWLSTARMRAEGQEPATIITSNARHLYWTPAQMVAHHSSNGCNLLPGDLLGTGTISGPTRAQLSSLLELTMGGSEPVTLPNGEQRGFLSDGDEITFTARCRRDGFVPIGFGACTGTIIP
ncbi:fumarylacetoacetase [Inquilinus sp. CA228]|uniref:fumarylacetoacetase n=1 Tax=Inquilinus sp. CA228 TaxID=3455609 RepID=UPI003F8D314B